jgi:hypothetical protein
MKKIITSLTIMSFSLLLASCGGDYSKIEFKDQKLVGVTTENISEAESWGGRWSDGSPATITFKNKLPKNFILDLEFVGFSGYNMGKSFEVKAGNQTNNFTASKAPQSVSLNFNNVDSNQIQIVIPNPVSPKDLGINSETRKLGMQIKSLEIKKP